MKKIVGILTAVLVLGILSGCTKSVKDRGNVSFADVNGFELVNDMECGWNLGNTFDATGSSGLGAETSWGQPSTTKGMIDALAASGIKSIRIPVSWHNHIIDKNLTVDPAWMERVKTVVDWALAADMYVILNTHHDCLENSWSDDYGYYVDSENYEKSEKYLTHVWSQICNAFNNGYGEKLIFEIWNEPRARGTEYEWWNNKNSSEYYDYSDNVNKLNQKLLNTIRGSGGNNKKRFVMITGLQASPDSALAGEFQMPEDLEEYVENPHIILSVHMYSPYKFAMETPGDIHLTNLHKIEVNNIFNQLEKKFSYAGYPVIVGEYGATNKGNLEDRVEWFKYFVSAAREHGFTCFVWDNGQADANPNEGERFGFFNRVSGKWYFPEIQQAIVENCK